ncbi:hypothetical protein ACFP3U_14900 [Kitasatospora misakiensis]|uniref:Ankyrin n=1 Tax=Kitasatospora misakiensis TaxID=67330 RepID=A0ABW0X520_9ACTN
MLATHPDQRRDDPSARPYSPVLPELRGDFEVHLTVAPGEAEALAAWAAAEGLTFTHIVLARGAAPSQPMLTLRTTGALDEVAAAAVRTADRLGRAGFTVLRSKLEAAPWALGVPESDQDALRHGPGRYFEHHVKLLLPGSPDPVVLVDPLANLADLADLADRHGAHLSRNPRRIREDGRREWFVTQRCRRVGLVTAGRRLDALLADLAAAGHAVLSTEREFVAVDSHEALDAGWLAEPDHTPGAPGPHREGDLR